MFEPKSITVAELIKDLSAFPGDMLIDFDTSVHNHPDYDGYELRLIQEQGFLAFYLMGYFYPPREKPVDDIFTSQ